MKKMSSHMMFSLLVMLAAPAVYGADGTWANNAGDRYWNTAANWSGNTIAQGSGSTATFNLAGGATITNDYPGLILGNIVAATANYTITDGTITLDSMTGTSTFDVAASRTLTMRSELAGSNSLTKQGAGTLTLSGTNTYSGGTVINSGIVYISAHANLGDAAGSLTLGGGRLQVTTAIAGNTSRDVVVTAAGGSMISAGGGAGAGFNTTGKLTGSGTLDFTYSSNGPRYFGFLSADNDFTGALSFSDSGLGFTVKSFADSTNRITFRNGASFTLHADATAPLVFNNRQIEIAGAFSPSINNNSTNQAATITIRQPLLVSGVAGNRTLTLGGTNTGTNLFSGAIANGAGTVNITKSGAGTWVLSGTNSYTGKTCALPGGPLVFQNAGQSVSPGTKLTLGIVGSSTMKLLSDTGGVTGTLNLGNTISPDFSGSYGGAGTMTLFGGNNGEANGGNGAGGVSNSTIVLGTLDLRSDLEGGLVIDRVNTKINITGADGYKLQIGDVIMQAQSHVSGANAIGAFFIPSTAPLTITGTVKQNNGRTAADLLALQTLTLDGTATDNVISGPIKDADDYTDSSNANALPMKLLKQNSSTWILSGVNTYSGSTTVSGGTLVIAGGSALISRCLSDTSLLAISGTGKVQLNDGVREAVGSLTIAGVTKSAGKWGASGNAAATYTNAVFTGNGLLYVGIPVPPTGTVIRFM